MILSNSQPEKKYKYKAYLLPEFQNSRIPEFQNYRIIKIKIKIKSIYSIILSIL
jgi:hypothetical protein